MKTKQAVFLVCTGLGRVNRGYESFARECFEALKNNEVFELYLIKGGGKTKAREFILPNIYRKSKAGLWLGKVLKLDPYLIEQFSFCVPLIPMIVLKKPAVIYYSDFILGTYLWHLRKLFKFKYKLLFSNGSPNPPPYKTEDHVQQLLKSYLEDAITKGEPESKQTLLPYGFEININERLENICKKGALKEKLRISAKHKVVLSIGAVNKFQKRMHHIVEEFATLPDEYFLIILGQFDFETPEIIAMAEAKVPGRYLISSVPMEEVKNYYVVADYFILGSLHEGFGRVLIEALSYGLPCIVHDYTNARQVLKDYGIYINMRKKGSLLRLLEKNAFPFKKEELIHEAYKYYSWDNLKYRYLDMITKVAKG